MIFKPIDEMSLRHLFSTNYAQEALRLSYIGPVLSAAGAIDTSPDCMILDMRKSPFRPRRCEFKFIPLGKEDFAHNGQFDIAVIWNVPAGRSKDQLLADLLQQNGCAEILALADNKAFYDLPTYTIESLSKLSDSTIVRDLAIRSKTGLPSVFGLCMAARLYPNKFDITRMAEFLATRFAEVKKMLPQGRGNVMGQFLQTKPPLIARMHGSFYRWTGEIDNVSAAAELSELLKGNFGSSAPSAEDLKAVSE